MTTMISSFDTTVRRATLPQIKYISDLLNELPLWHVNLTGRARDTALNVWANTADQCVERITITDASDTLDALLKLRRDARSSAKPSATSHHGAPQLSQALKQINLGRYALPRKKDGVVDAFEVVERPNGQRFLNQLLGGNVSGTKFHRKRLNVALQAAAARAILVDQKAAALLYADTYCECPRCGVALTHPRSKLAKIGKVCAGEWGWVW